MTTQDFYAQIAGDPNVVGAAIGYEGGDLNGPIHYLALVEKESAGVQNLPRSYLGAFVSTLEVGKIRALARTDRVRPAPGGVSVGHYSITAGTLGMIVQREDRWFILSNNHVLAASNGGEIGDPILQPGAYDGGSAPNDVIGTLADFVPIVFNDEPPAPPSCNFASLYAGVGNAIAAALGSRHRVLAYRDVAQATNVVDAAIAEVEHGDVDLSILEIGEITGVVSPELGMAVRKSGRSSGLSTGQIIGVDAVVTVGYGGNLSATFENQIITTGMSEPGDSGSVLVDGESQNAVGLLFAGSDQVTIHGVMSTVMDLLEVEPVVQGNS